LDVIIDSMSDANWWFNTLFNIIIGVIAAGLLQNKIDRYFSDVSVRFRAWRARSIAARKAIINSLADNSVFLNLAFHRAILSVLVYIMTMLLFVSAPLLLETSVLHDNFMWFGQKEFARNFLMPLTGLTSIVAAYKASIRLSISFDAFKAYREKHGLPKLP